MIELTRVVNVQITTIARMDSEEEIYPADIAKKVIEEALRQNIDCDDLVVTNIQDFIMEK